MASKKNTKSQISATRVERSIRFRFNPLSQLSPEYLVRCHNNFTSGWLRPAAILWDEIEDTDDIIKSVAPKRKKAVSRHGYNITTVEKSDRADQHAKTLKQFYDNITVTSALDLNERGGMPLLIRQMQDAVGKKYSVHEIIWRYRSGILSATFKHVPLQFFENRTGRLRYLQNDYDQEGVDLDPGAWMVTVGDGIMRACATAYMFKHLSLGDWLIFCEKYGFPIIIGKSSGKPGDDEWESMEDAVADASGGDSIVTNLEAEIEALKLGDTGDLPWPKLIDRMDRSMSTLWRGGDLSTLSADDAVGVNAQDEEKDILEEDDAQNDTDVLNEQVDRFVIKYVHGDATPLAWVQIKTAQRQDIKLDLETDKGLEAMGYVDKLEDVRDRYSRPNLERKIPDDNPSEPDDASPDAEATASNEAGAAGAAPAVAGPADAYLAQASSLYAQARANDMRPLAERLGYIIESVADEDLEAELTQLAEDFPDIADQVLDGMASVDALDDAQTGALVNGIVETEVAE